MTQSVLEQIAVAFKKGNRRAAWFSIPFGASVPLATAVNGHSAESLQDPLALLAAGGLLYSGLTVFSWMRRTLLAHCESRLAKATATLKAAGLVVLVEGTLVYSPHVWLSVLMLLLLAAANAIALHSEAVTDRKQARRTRRKAKSK